VLDAASTTGRKYWPFLSHVVLTIGHVGAITSANPPYADHGSVPEWQAAVFIPAVAGHEVLGLPVPQRLVLLSPYVLVDNPISLLGGREIYGLPKALAEFHTGPPGTWRDEAIEIDVYGGDFGPTRAPAWTKLVSVTPAGPHGGAGPPWTNPGAFAGWVLSAIGGELEDWLVKWLAERATDLTGEVAKLLGIDGWVASLKQFRDPNDGTMACYSRLVESSMRITNFGGRPSAQSWNVDFATIDSHPLVSELGLGNLAGATAFEIEMDFDLGGVEYY
jgi:hypothetical protein